MELHVKRHLVGTDVLTTTASLDADVVSVKISLNDVVLANSILSRANIVKPTGNQGGENGGQGQGSGVGSGKGQGQGQGAGSKNATPSRARSSTSSTNPLSPPTPTLVPTSALTSSSSATADAVAPSTLYDLVAQLRSVSLVLINDFNHQNIPILKVSLVHSDCRAGGRVGALEGEGSFQIMAAYYNTTVSVWEPILEQWGPTITVTSSKTDTHVEVVSDSTIQVDVSGAMVKSFSQVLNLTSTVLEQIQSSHAITAKQSQSQYQHQHQSQNQNQSHNQTISYNQNHGHNQNMDYDYNHMLTAVKPVNDQIITTLRNTRNYNNDNNNNNNNNNGNNKNNNDINNDRKTIQSKRHENENENSNVHGSQIRGTDSPVVFENHLEFPIEIFDSITLESLMVLRAGENGPLLSPNLVSRSWMQNQGKHPTLFNVRVLGRFKDHRLPLLQLSLNMNNPRPYSLQPNLSTGPKGLGGLKGSDRSRGTEPIVEVTYENQRYHPLEMQWATPWPDLKDPPTWSDALGYGPRNPSSVRLPSECWEWVEGDWNVQFDGIVGIEIDEEGWEYANNFTAFSISNKRRTKKPLDVTRRRKWTRSRISKSSASDELLRPLTVVWDVKTLQNGSRLALIRSGLQVKNDMSFAISVAIDGFPGQAPSLIFNLLEEGDQDSRPDSRITHENENGSGNIMPIKAGTVGRTGGQTARIFDNIPEGRIFSLPLLLSSASVMRVRPYKVCNEGNGNAWSQSMACRANNTVTWNGKKDEKDSSIQIIKEKEDGTSLLNHFRVISAPEGALLTASDQHDLICGVEQGSAGRDRDRDRDRDRGRDRERDRDRGRGRENGPVTSNACIRGLILTADRSRLVACVPYATCHNLLPCELEFQFLSGDGNTEQVQCVHLCVLLVMHLVH